MAEPTFMLFDGPHSREAVEEARERAAEARRKAAEPGVFHDIEAVDRPLSECEIAAMVRGCMTGPCATEGTCRVGEA